MFLPPAIATRYHVVLPMRLPGVVGLAQPTASDQLLDSNVTASAMTAAAAC